MGAAHDIGPHSFQVGRADLRAVLRVFSVNLVPLTKDLVGNPLVSKRLMTAGTAGITALCVAGGGFIGSFIVALQHIGVAHKV